MSDEPVYCTNCGKEYCNCTDEQRAGGNYCEVCGVIPARGKECKFFREGGNDKPCEPEVRVTWLESED